MRLLHRFYRNINLLNILLFSMIAALAIFVISPPFLMKLKYTLPAGKPKIGLLQEIPGGDIQTPPLHDYAVIGENNLFHPERKLIKEVKPQSKPDLILYGTIIGNGTDIAFIEDKKSPKTSAGRGKRQTAVKKGDVLSGFVLKEIETDRIVLSRGEETMVIYLTETGKQRGSETTLSSPKTISPTAATPVQPFSAFTPVPGGPPATGPEPVTGPAPAAVAPR